MAVGEFVMMHKGKGGTDDMAQYRAVCLEEVGLKLVASIMLARLSVEVGETRSKMTQEGSGKGKDSSSQDGLFANLSPTGQDTGKKNTFRELRRGSGKDGQLETIATLSEL